MAFGLGNVMEMFRGNVQQPQSNQLNSNNQNQQNNQQSTQTQTQATNPQGTQVAVVKEPSPEETFKDFWQIDPKKDTVPQDLSQFNFNFDAKKVDETVRTMDFTRGVSADLVKKVAAGGEEAVTAMLAMMNNVGQQVMRNAVIASAKVTESGLQSSGQRLSAELPGLVRSQTVSNALRGDNPLFSDPTTAPVLAAFEQQASIKFPNATPDEIRAHARTYMAHFAKKAAEFTGMEVTPAKPAPTAKQSATQFDWTDEPI